MQIRKLEGDQKPLEGNVVNQVSTLFILFISNP